MKEYIGEALKSMEFDFSDIAKAYETTKRLYDTCDSDPTSGVEYYERQYIDSKMSETYNDLQDPFKADTEETRGKVQDLLYSVIFLARGERIITDYLSGDGFDKEAKQSRINDTVRSFMNSHDLGRIVS